MGEFSWGPESPSNVEEGGNYRRRKDKEPSVTGHKLSEAEEAVRGKMEALNERELTAIEAVLAKEGLLAADILNNQKVKDWMERQVPFVRYQKLDEHFQTLKTRENARRRLWKKAS
jgi:hypothetical protein